MSWTQSERITQMVGEMSSVFCRRKMWIPLTKYGKNDEEFGFTLISSFLWRRFGSTPNSSIVNTQLCGCISFNKSKFLLEAAGNKKNESETMEGGACKMPFCVGTINSTRSLSRVPFVIVLNGNHNWGGRTLFHYCDSTSITYQLQ